MKVWKAALVVLALGGSAFTAAFVGARFWVGGEGFSGALANVRRAGQPKASPSAASQPPVVASRAHELPPIDPESLPKAPRFRQTNTYNGNVVLVPEDCQGSYDLILHFHGAHPYVRELVEKASLDAVVVIYNSGNGAERYAQAFQAGGMLRSLLRQIEMAVEPLCGGTGATPGRIALSAWSAGYAAIEKLLARPQERERIDAVLLADGLHAPFVDLSERELAPNALQSFREFGELAKRGRKLFAITHSSIATDGYASTTECSRLLLRALDVPVEGPFVSGTATGFSVEGSAGEDAAAHVAQFRQMDATLLAKLRERWAGSR
jgi:hypothetical protein